MKNSKSKRYYVIISFSFVPDIVRLHEHCIFVDFTRYVSLKPFNAVKLFTALKILDHIFKKF